MSAVKQAHARAEVRADWRDVSGDLLAYFGRRVHNREDAADLLGETMLQAWRRRDVLPNETARQRMWLFTIAANVVHARNNPVHMGWGGK